MHTIIVMHTIIIVVTSTGLMVAAEGVQEVVGGVVRSADQTVLVSPVQILQFSLQITTHMNINSNKH